MQAQGSTHGARAVLQLQPRHHGIELAPAVGGHCAPFPLDQNLRSIIISTPENCKNEPVDTPSTYPDQTPITAPARSRQALPEMVGLWYTPLA